MGDKMETRDEQVERIWSEILAELQSSTDGYPLCVEERRDPKTDAPVLQILLNGRDVSPDQWGAGLLRIRVNKAVKDGILTENRSVDRPDAKQFLYVMAPDAG